jgi:hypothetical protein
MSHPPFTQAHKVGDLLIRSQSGERAISRRPVTAAEHYAAAKWLGDSAERVAFWRGEAEREAENHCASD